MYLALKTVYYKLYSNLQLLPILIHKWKNLSMNFITSLPILTNWKSESYNPILVIINYLINIIYYKLIKITIDTLELAKVIINIVMYHHNISKSIIMDLDSFFISKF